ncbi:MAG: putative ABC transport system permease protein [Saprospiraceae bacterium]|jgi:putative ABC transport system permease protein
MLRSYTKIAFRNLFNQKGYSLINIVGLSISLAVTLLMLLWVQDEWSTDRFHDKSDNIYRMKRTIPLEGNSLDVYNSVSYPVLAAAQSELPEVLQYTLLGRSFEETIQREDLTIRAAGSYGNAAYFEIFSYPILIGDITQLDKKKDAIALSERLATTLYGPKWERTALGQTLHMHDIGDFIVEAVYANFPDNSSIQNEFIYSFDSYLNGNDWMLEWTNSGTQGALLLAEGADVALTAQKIEDIYQEHQDKDRKEGILLQKFADHYLYGQFDERANVTGGRIEYVKTFGIAALLLLFISCINFVNLATARASKRAKEVGVRKTIGASKRSLITQFLIESGMITFISIGVAILFAKAALPQVNIITEKMLHLDLTQPIIWIGIFSIFILTTILAGAYPSFVLSQYRPINVLSGSLPLKSGKGFLKKGLVVMQFVLALLLIVGALVVEQQVQYIKNKNLGIAKDNLVMIHQDAKITESYDALRNELLKQEGIVDVTVVGPSPLDMQASTSGVGWPGKRPDQENMEFQMVWTASNFLDVFDVPLVAGRYYREGSIYDTTSLVFNESAIEIMGLKEPVGKTIQWWGSPRQIIGVVKDFHNQSLYEKIKPAAFLLDSEDAGWLFVKSSDTKISAALSGMEASFKTILPDVPLHYEFVDKQYEKFYKSEILTGTLAKYFAVFSIFLSCLGLLGLATFFAEQKSKEISIRKVLGASIYNLVGFLSKEFLILVSLGLLIGIPISWFILSDWLTTFQYTIELQVWMFALPAFLAIVIAGMTVGYQTVKAAIANPIQSLRNE